MPWLIQEHWSIENAAFWHYLMPIRTHLSVVKSLWPRLVRTCIKPKSIHCVGQTFYVWFRQKVNSLVKIWIKFIDMVTKRQNIKDHSVSSIFSFQFSAIEIRLIFSHAKLFWRHTFQDCKTFSSLVALAYLFKISSQTSVGQFVKIWQIP